MSNDYYFYFSIIIAYLLGSIPFGLLLAKTFCNIDPRLGGSCNVGATNVARLCGKKWGFTTLAFDLAKGVMAILISYFFISRTTVSLPYPYLPQLTGCAVILGHMFPLFLKFKGGKGVATTVGVYLALAPFPFSIAAVLCVLVIWRTSFVSAGSLVLVISLPLLLFIWGDNGTGVLSLITGFFVVYAHRENIKRLLSGCEKPWTGKKL